MQLVSCVWAALTRPLLAPGAEGVGGGGRKLLNGQGGPGRLIPARARWCVSEVPGRTPEGLTAVAAFRADRTRDPTAGPSVPALLGSLAGNSGTAGVLVSLVEAVGFWLKPSEVRRPEGSPCSMLPGEGFGVFTRLTQEELPLG